MVAFVGVHLSVDRQHPCHLLQLAKPALLIEAMSGGSGVQEERLALVRAESERSASRLRALRLQPDAQQADYLIQFRGVANKTRIVIQ
jgi:hypothetical protein